MDDANVEPQKLTDLRRQAEEALKERAEDLQNLSAQDIRSLVQELRLHQVELEMQNEELRRAQRELEESRNKYSDLYDFAPIGYFTFDKNGLILEVNLTGARKLGVERHYLLNQPFSLYVAPGSKETFYSHLKQVFSTGTRQICELKLVDKNKTQFYARLESLVVLDGEGRPGRCRTAISDITERKRIEEKLFFLASIVESSDDAIIGKTPDGTILSWNLGAQKLYGYSADEVTGKSISILVPPDRPDEIPQLLERVRLGQRIELYETVHMRKDGRRIDVSLTISPIKDEAGRITGASTIAHDITERKRWIAELARSNTELEQFAYVASHDLQEPLRMMSGFTQLLAKRYRGKLDKDADDFIAYIVDGAARMQRMIEDLLAYARVGTRGKPFEPTDCEATFNQAIANLKEIIEQNGAVITHDPLPTIVADSSQIAQLFQNLIGNAIKFRKKEEPPRIHVFAERKGDEWVFFVKDNGIGIAPELFGHLFQIFARSQAAREYPGTGIGLAICKKIVERHCGRIWAESELGKGSTFYFTIPVRTEQKG